MIEIMPHVSIKILNRGEALSSAEKGQYLAELRDFIIMEGGMRSGKNTVAFIFTDDKGHTYSAQTSATLFNNMCVAFHAAEERFSQTK